MARDGYEMRRARAERHAVYVQQCREEAGLPVTNSETRLIADGYMAGESEARERYTADLAECYRLSGADPDGDEDWRLAERAVEEVRRLRTDYDKAAADLDAARELLREVRDYFGDWCQETEGPLDEVGPTAVKAPVSGCGCLACRIAAFLERKP